VNGDASGVVLNRNAMAITGILVEWSLFRGLTGERPITTITRGVAVSVRFYDERGGSTAPVGGF
jgi:hypothetical protein